jgi:dTDP-4-amino-4,6-dideoxygalactose transaminase
VSAVQETTPRAGVPFATTEITAAAHAAVAEVLRSGWVTTGPQVGEFEREFADWVGAQHGVAVASCTTAIELALRALDLPSGARVLTSTMTFCGAVHAIVHAGFQPVLVDVHPETLMPDEHTVAEARLRNGPVDAMVVLHFAGHPAPVRAMAEAAGLPLDRVIEDAAHAVGTWVDGEQVGTISAATCFSFYATKNLPIGEGGMVTTANRQIADRVRRMRLHGMSKDAWRRYEPGAAWRYEVDVAGLKANMTDIQAAIGRAQLRRLTDWQQRRAEIADRYDQHLFAVPGIARPARPTRGLHAWHLYVVRVDARRAGVTRDELIAALTERSIGTSVHFIPNHHQPYFQRLLGEDIATAFPTADAVFGRIVSLPLHPGLTDQDVDTVCEAVLDVVSSPRPSVPHQRPVLTVPPEPAPQSIDLTGTNQLEVTR